MENDRLVKSPAFQFYAAEWISDEHVSMMSLEEEGAYIRLLAYCWREGSISSDLESLSRLCKGGSTTLIAVVAKRFQPHPNLSDRLVHPRLELEREKQRKWREKSAEGGRASGQTRRKSPKSKDLQAAKGGSRVVEPNGKRTGWQMVEPNGNSSSSFTNKEIHTSASAEGQPKPNDGLFQTLARVCRIDYRVCTTEQRGALNQTVGILRKANHTSDEVERVGEWWFTRDWRGKQGQAPKPHEIREVWQQAFEPLGHDPSEHPNAYRPGKMIT